MPTSTWGTPCPPTASAATATLWRRRHPPRAGAIRFSRSCGITASRRKCATSLDACAAGKSPRPPERMGAWSWRLSVRDTRRRVWAPRFPCPTGRPACGSPSTGGFPKDHRVSVVRCLTTPEERLRRFENGARGSPQPFAASAAKRSLGRSRDHVNIATSQVHRTDEGCRRDGRRVHHDGVSHRQRNACGGAPHSGKGASRDARIEVPQERIRTPSGPRPQRFLGLIISDVENPFFPELIKSFEDFVMERGCDVLLCATNYHPERSRKAVARMIENKVLGVAVVTAQIGVGLIEELTDADIPVFRVDAAEPPGRCLSNVRVDYSTGAKEAVAHLKALGHRDIAYIAGPRTRTSAVTCRQAFSDALQSLRLPRPRTVEVNNDMDGGAAAARTLLDGSELPTAIICCNDLAALGAMRALLEAGVRVPRDVSILGVDDISFARYATPALTTVRVPRDR